MSVTVAVHPGSHYTLLFFLTPVVPVGTCTEPHPVPLGTVGGRHTGQWGSSELSGRCASGEGIAQVTLSGTSAGMIRQIAFAQRAGGVLWVTESGAFPSS